MERRQFLIGASTILTSAFVAKAEWFLEKEKAVILKILKKKQGRSIDLC